MKPVKTVWYSDPLHDDFANTNGKIHTEKVGAGFPYLHGDVVWRLFAFLLYRVIATPVAWLFCRLRFGLRVKNRRALRGLHGGFYLYGNHTQSVADAFIPSLAVFPRKTYIVTSDDAVSIPFVRFLVPMLGGMPLPTTLEGNRKFRQASEQHLQRGSVITIYPEAHIWPYYNGIRPFSEVSFAYPAKYGVPAVACTVTYRERKWRRSAPPLITVTLSGPFYPPEDGRQAKTILRDRVYESMCHTVREQESVEYIAYRQKAEKTAGQ